MVHLDLFSGIGGFSLGLNRAGLPITRTLFSEIDKYAISVYRRKFPDAESVGDITKIEPERLPYADIITFGSPCVDLSVAGKQAGIFSPRSGLFFKAVKIIGIKKPHCFVFENVKGLFSSNKGEDFEIVLKTFAEIGYDVQWQLLNTRWFLPQNRERVYFVGHLRGRSRPQIFPIGEGNEFNSSDDKKLSQIGFVRDNLEANRIYDPSGISRTIKFGGGMGAKTGLYAITKDKFGGDGKGTVKISEHSNALDTRYGYGIDSRGARTGVISFDGENIKVRRLTPVETERLQGFPDNWTALGVDGETISDTQRYKMTGNAVSVPVMKAIAERLAYKSIA